MQKVIIRATIAICTLSTGVAISLLVNKYQARRVPTGDIPAVELKLVPYITERWRRVDINQTFSFYLPQTMTTDLPRYRWGSPAGSFSDTTLKVSYVYSDGLSCEPDLAVTKFEDQTAEVRIAGKTAKLETSRSPGSDRFMTLCFPDIGDHRTKLQLAATGSDANAMNVAKQIFDSIEFR